MPREKRGIRASPVSPESPASFFGRRRGPTLAFGAALHGYGFTLSVLITLCTGLILLPRQLNRLEYEAFMLQ
ncbi:hypothetical protein MASR1M42_19990 [Azonexus hydrophilus]